MKLKLLLIFLVAYMPVCVLCLTSNVTINTDNLPCYNTSDCNFVSYTNYYCDKNEDKCKCEDPLTYMKEFNDYICLLPVGIYNQSCDYDEQCPTVNYCSYNYYDADCPVSMCSNDRCHSSECVDSICQCKPGFYYDGTQCRLPQIEYGGKCLYDEQCYNEDDRHCSDDGKCECYGRYWYRINYDRCIPLWDGGPLSGVIFACFTAVIILAGILGYFGYRYFETKKLEKYALLDPKSSSA